MKILELRFKNLNSLYGEWSIDFTDPEYVSNGIFALTGPTGAGKSTILDALCLALYGTTPRLGKITKSGNEIMSRQTGECFSEVLFESQAGRYLCHWEQRRSRKSPDGRLQDQEHQIIDAETRRPIETKKSLVAGVIEEKTGMDFDRFTRSMLLAQGGFDTFLKAEAEEKSRILEQITGTEIYSEISRGVHERYREQREKLNILQGQTSAIVLLDSEEQQKIEQDLKTEQIQESAASTAAAETARALTWLKTMDELNREINNLKHEQHILQEKIEAFKPRRLMLEQAVKAASLDGVYASLTAVRKQQSDDLGALKSQHDILPDLEDAVTAQAEILKKAEQKTAEARKEVKTLSPLIQKVRFIDQSVVHQKKVVSQVSDAVSRETATIRADIQARQKELEKRTEAAASLEAVVQYLSDHVQDEMLISSLEGIEQQVISLLDRQEEISHSKKEISLANAAMKDACRKMESAKQQSLGCEKKLEEAAEELRKGKDRLRQILGTAMLREYRSEKEALLREMAYIRKIGELEDYRSSLEDGKPCPLCGSTEHPFAGETVPTPDETEQRIEKLTELITKAEDQESAIQSLEQSEAEARKNLIASEKLEGAAANEMKSADAALGALKISMEKLQLSFANLKLSVLNKLQPLGITMLPETDVSLLLETLTSRLEAWKEQVRKKQEAELQISSFDREIHRLDAVIETQGKALDEKQVQLEGMKEELDALIENRKTLYGDKNPDDEEKRLYHAAGTAEDQEKQARELLAEVQQNLAAVKANAESLKTRIANRDADLKKAEEDFLAASNIAGFSHEQEFQKARMPNEQRELFTKHARELEARQVELNTRMKDRVDRLAKEKSKQITEASIEELEATLKEFESSLQLLRESIAGRRHALVENTAAKQRMEEKLTAVEAQKTVCLRWGALHNLIGSADGKKYRNFAQGITFERMVSHANRQLESMTDRYLLIRDEQHPLELNVVDTYQAGEIRSTRNLSGGESFIVSLSLALGLSKMSSRKVRVDSLFLDEGFGTLDEESLETALETLSGLQQDGKLIGIISHVTALKERISTRITVTPVTGGRSSLSGPGCKRIER